MASGERVQESKSSPVHWKYLPLLAEIWIFATIATFIVVRVLASNSAKYILHVIQGR